MSVVPALPAGWLARLARRLDRPPEQPRVPLWWASHAIGSVEPGWTRGLHTASPACIPLLREARRGAVAGYEIVGEDLTASLGPLADAMRAAGRVHAWRDEQLAVRGDGGSVLGTIERGAVRPLGIATHAVHLAGLTADGRHWVQQRSLDKATDPGLWDTLMGGMVPASDSSAQALERETWEEAGLRLRQLQDLRPCGRVLSRGPSAEVPGGYVVEVIDCWRAVLPPGVVPVNQDGEVRQFRLVDGAGLVRMLASDAFTLEAAGVYAAAGA